MKFGTLKSKMFKALTESFSEKKKDDVKNIIKTFKANSDFKEMYFLYEDVETKYFEDEETAKSYVNELGSMLKKKQIYEKRMGFGKFLLETSKPYKDIEITENKLYDLLDVLSEDDSLSNIDKKIIAKKELVSFLTKPKETKKENTEIFTENENLLHAVLTNNFNVLYSNTLNEEQKTELKNILSLSNEQTEDKIKELKESISNQVNILLGESKSNSELVDKLTKVKEEIDSMSISKYNYYRLTQLKNGL